MNAPPRLFDRDLHRRRLDRAAPRFSAAGFLKARAAADAVERLEAILRSFPLAVDLGARNGAFSHALAGSDAAQRVGAVIETDLSAAMLKGRAGQPMPMRAQMDEERLAFADESLDLVVSLLALHWSNDTPGALIQIRNRGLRHGPPEVMARLAAGEEVDPAEYYFRTVPEFIAPNGPYEWMNRSIFVCAGARYPLGIRLWVWRVT